MKRELHRSSKIRVKKSRTHGYGVFAEEKIRKGELLEECYFIISKGGDKILEDFYFDVNGKNAIFTGFGSIYNHADEPNADYFINSRHKVATIKASKTIHKGEEIFVCFSSSASRLC